MQWPSKMTVIAQCIGALRVLQIWSYGDQTIEASQGIKEGLLKLRFVSVPRGSSYSAILYIISLGWYKKIILGVVLWLNCFFVVATSPRVVSSILLEWLSCLLNKSQEMWVNLLHSAVGYTVCAVGLIVNLKKVFLIMKSCDFCVCGCFASFVLDFVRLRSIPDICHCFRLFLCWN